MTFARVSKTTQPEIDATQANAGTAFASTYTHTMSSPRAFLFDPYTPEYVPSWAYVQDAAWAIPDYQAYAPGPQYEFELDRADMPFVALQPMPLFYPQAGYDMMYAPEQYGFMPDVFFSAYGPAPTDPAWL